MLLTHRFITLFVVKSLYSLIFNGNTHNYLLMQSVCTRWSSMVILVIIFSCRVYLLDLQVVTNFLEVLVEWILVLCSFVWGWHSWWLFYQGNHPCCDQIAWWFYQTCARNGLALLHIACWWNRNLHFPNPLFPPCSMPWNMPGFLLE